MGTSKRVSNNVAGATITAYHATITAYHASAPPIPTARARRKNVTLISE